MAAARATGAPISDRERENRHLRAEQLRAREDLEQERAKVAYLTGEIAELRKRIPTTRRQAAAPTVGASRPKDPLERLMEAIRLPPSECQPSR